MLSHDRSMAESELNAADKILHTRLPALHLTEAPTT
jgi:hypothetical protein